MLLKDWKESENLTNRALARLLNCSPSHVGLLLKHKRAPSKKLTEKIAKITMGAVSTDEALFPERFSDSPPSL